MWRKQDDEEKGEATQYGHVGRCATEQGTEQVLRGKARFYQNSDDGS